MSQHHEGKHKVTSLRKNEFIRYLDIYLQTLDLFHTFKEQNIPHQTKNESALQIIMFYEIDSAVEIFNF